MPIPAPQTSFAPITPAGGTARGFGYDAAGDITTDSAWGRRQRAGADLRIRRRGKAGADLQTATPANGSTYSYNSDSRLSQRVVTQTVTPTSTTILYAYDTNNHIIAELNSSGQTLREYIWLNDMPVAVVDNVNTSP